MKAEKFNIFGSKNTKQLNENGHSLFLKRLLSPNGQHNLENFFLKHFVEVVLECSFDETQPWVAEKEKQAGKGRTDLCIRSKSFSIVIENKIYAKDENSQLYRYWRNKIYRETTYNQEMDNKKWEQSKLIYLTRYGIPPQEISLHRPYDSSKKYDGFPDKLSIERITCISYKEHMSKWIEECIGTIDKIQNPRLVCILEQYKEWIDDILEEKK